MRSISLAQSLLVLFLGACGGSDDTPTSRPQTQEEQYQALLESATQAKAEAVLLAAAEPCSSDSQCSTLSFRDPFPPCHFTSSVDYSMAAPTAAAASAAAANYDSLARQAEAIAAPSNITGSCSTNVDLKPLICLENKCQRGFRIDGPG